MGHNSVLNDDQEKALFHQHLASWEKALAVKKAADAAYLQQCKRAKADVGEHAILSFKLAVGFRGDKEVSAKELQARRDREARVARWMGLPVNTQASLFDTDRRTAEERTYQEGFEAGASGLVALKVPDQYGAASPQGQAWSKGWSDGQESIFKIKELREGPTLLKKGTPELDEETETEGDA